MSLPYSLRCTAVHGAHRYCGNDAYCAALTLDFLTVWIENRSLTFSCHLSPPTPSPFAHILLSALLNLLIFFPIPSSSPPSFLLCAPPTPPLHTHQPPHISVSILMPPQSAVLSLESLLGQENVRTMAMFLETVIRFLAEGAASGLNVIAVYVTEILRVTGFDVALTLPRFTPEGVTAVAQWGLVGLIGYWVLTVILRLLFGVFRHMFWVVKMVLALWLFGLIVTDKHASAETTATRVGVLVLAFVLLTLFTSGFDKSSAVEHRLSKLERRVRDVERTKAD
ncbi:uncharacterized protein si:dkey-74k8.3 isoform X1 [Kryptolebias marmoratus]|uniref:uncharacterized protein si:dkey-74k8.3 isoform X1 n=1 Tax=Kryptolebias marmoratus TaxID=37003 RepID=UPI0007F92C5B|nr:uncharacterized protein si:dkey-74k8.3 isoform X1 [Kryptolebias marmoratus]